MKVRIQDGRPIRPMDPLFREIFENHDHIHMKIEDIRGGVRVTETADESPRASRPTARADGSVRVRGRRDATSDAAHSAPTGLRAIEGRAATACALTRMSLLILDLILGAAYLWISSP